MSESSQKKQPRDTTFWKVLNCALELDFKKGHLKWTMSELSRKSGITRSLIYYHFGRSKVSILDKAIQVIGEEMVGFSPERMALWKSGDWGATLRRGRAVCTQSPHLGNFYLLHRERPTDIGKSLKSLEANYLKKIQTLFPHLDASAHKALFALFFGVAFSPHVDESAIDYIVTAVKNLVGSTESNITLRTGAVTR